MIGTGPRGSESPKQAEVPSQKNQTLRTLNAVFAKRLEC